MNKEFHNELLTDADFSMRRRFYEESKRQDEKADNHQCEHCDSNRITREVYENYWLCESCELELYDA